eukprot:CAMPEP_0170493402 /NCGR_PEP_ID=MMETSP0208-20121228/13839_1 /TAXON_ID=197538 /ORGANISM="Strombidium inclinatum, Strain S3" /LENGTH=193 /DNA_ID=CAMNT_0010769329 /DNA_START=12 /DNA_END=593 /DNA_ORIENTATION=+
MKFIVAMFVGLVAAEEPVWSLRSIQDHRTDSEVQKAYGDHSTKQANGRPPYQSAMQLAGDDEEEDHSKEVFHAHQSGMLDDGYKREITPRFIGDSDDIFMRSMINTYAQEHKNKDGSPNGVFTINEPSARAAAAEVLATHKGLSGAALSDYLNTYFPKAWGHFDVNRGGSVEVIKMPQFMRFLASDQYMSLGE